MEDASRLVDPRVRQLGVQLSESMGASPLLRLSTGTHNGEHAASSSAAGLEDFINDQLFDDPIQIKQVAQHLNKCAMKSSLPDQTIRLVQDRRTGNFSISINLTAK